jgi:hypothetical protein
VVRRSPVSPLAAKSWAIGASRAYASPGAAADQPGVQDGTSLKKGRCIGGDRSLSCLANLEPSYILILKFEKQ